MTPPSSPSERPGENDPKQNDPKQSNQEQFVLLYSRHQPAIRSYIASLLPRAADAEEVVQQTSLVLWRKFPTLDRKADFLRWACQVAKFEVFNHRRRLSRDRHVFCDELLALLAEEAGERADRFQERREALDGCLNKLHARQRDVIERCYREETTMREIAQTMGCTANSLYKRLNRIRDALLKCIKHTLAVEGQS